MDAFTAPGLVEAWFAFGTKAGKSFGAAAGLARRALTQEHTYMRWVAPIYAQTKIGFKYSKKMFPPEPYTKINNSDLRISIPGIDSTLDFLSGKFPEDLEGEGVHAYALDECAKMSRQVYDSAKTTTTVTHGPIVAFSTPRGKNWFYTKCMEARERMIWCLKRGIPPTHLFVTAPSSDSPLVTAEAIEEARRALPDRLFRQYYEAEFIDDGSVFVGYRDLLRGELLTFEKPDHLWVKPNYDTRTGTVVIGADWAKTKDWTVFTAIDLQTREIVAFQRFHKTPYTEAIRRLVIFSRKFADVLAVKHDKTGLGTVIDDQLAYTELPYEGVTFTNANKAQMVGQLITGIEHKDIWLPNWSILLDELESYEVQTNATGNMSYAATVGKHDDVVSSLMLAYAAVVQYSSDSGVVKTLEDLMNPKENDESVNTPPPVLSPIEQFYADISEDD